MPQWGSCVLLPINEQPPKKKEYFAEKFLAEPAENKGLSVVGICRLWLQKLAAFLDCQCNMNFMKSQG